MRNFYRIEVIDLRFQVDEINLKKYQLVEEHRGAPHNARIDPRLIAFLIKLRELGMSSDGHEITQVKVV